MNRFLVGFVLLFGFSVTDAANVTTSVTAGSLKLDSPGPVTLTWTASGASKCTAGGDWSGSKNVIGGSETIQVTKTSTFSLTCESPTGPAKVIWTPPTTNNDGSPVSLKGFVIFNGPSPTALSRLIDVPGGANTSAQVQVTPGLNYFSVRSVDTNDIESLDSNTPSKTVVADKATSSITVSLAVRPNPPTNVIVQ